MAARNLTFAGCLLLLAACDAENAYTLYRNSALPNGADFRIHVASFDAREGDSYNRENCDLARSLFQAQPGVTVRFWCEKGRYRK